VRFHSQVINGVNFISMDDIFGTVMPDQVKKFKLEAKKGMPIVLCMHVPFMSQSLYNMSERFWRNSNRKYTDASHKSPRGDFKRQLEDPVTSDFIKYLKKEPSLKAILCGHLHLTMEEDFSATAKQYVVGGNFLYHGQEILFS
jgi:UDP-2,3-diacylglucosamine pyrophosphatase LpxH